MKDLNFNAEEILKRIDQQVRVISKYMKLDSSLDENAIFFDNTEFQYLMNISKRTAQSCRDEGIISYSQIGNKIYYKLSDIKKLLEKNYINNNRVKRDFTTNI
jgi:DNA-binding MarR family transcriptional regulator